jgi:DNA-binding protein YbaB
MAKIIKKQQFMNRLPKNENQQVEFKMSFNEDVIETLVAFSNAEGGTVYIGVSAKGKPEGITIGQETIQNSVTIKDTARTKADILTQIEQVDAQIDEKVSDATGVQVGVQVEKLLLCVDSDFFTTKEIQIQLGLKQRHKVFTNYIQHALKLGLIEMTIPDKPNSRLQKYRLTVKGKRIKNKLI